MTLFELIDRYAARRLVGKAKSTELKYRRIARDLGKMLGRMPTVEDLTDDNVADLMARKLAAGRSPYTVNDARSKLVALWTFAAKRGLCSRFPDVDRLHEPESAPVAWTEQQLADVFAACELAIGEMGGVPGPLWWRALISVLWDTGERIGAVLSLEWTRLADGVLHVPADRRKGKTRDKLYTLHPDTVAILQRTSEYHSGPLMFPASCTYQSLFNRLRSMLRRAGLPHDRKHLFHCLRRSVASHAAACGADASRLMDHSDPVITRRYYLDPRIVPAPKAVDVLFRPGSPRRAS